MKKATPPEVYHGADADRRSVIDQRRAGAGEGQIARLPARPVLSAVPWVREVPGIDGKGPDARNIQMPRRLAGERERALPELDAPHVAMVQAGLLSWYAVEGRDLPWRRTRDPYAILVSEVMLQQTQVERVIPKWHAWLAEFPTLRALATASPAAVIRAWQGLGYNRRAVSLHGLAREVVARFDGRLPGTVAELRSLRGVGPYTAAAVACFAFGQAAPVVDTNVRRVLGRVFGCPTRSVGETERLAEVVLPKPQAYAWNQALMDLGATVCAAGRPKCLMCPLLGVCRTAGDGVRTVRRVPSGERWQGSQRFYRGRLVDELRALPSGARLIQLGPKVRRDFAEEHRGWLGALARSLAADGLIEVEGSVEALDQVVVRLPR
jgi:A/G-specific adenine glycosylase